MKTVYRKDQPHLFDVPIDEIQTALNNECSWLNTIFGRCERLVKEVNSNKYFTANWHKSGNDYVLVAPDEGLGNFCFFSLDEPTNLDTYFAGDVTRGNVGFSLILWCDLRTINTNRNTEAIKEEILQILNERTHLHSGRLSINKVYERAENVFREFDYNELDNQYNMHPFAAFRFEGELIVDTLCAPYIPPMPPTPTPSYIKGHIVDGSSTYTFKVNSNETINVSVNANGDWIWEVDRTITSLKESFQAKTANLNYLELYLPNSHSLTDMSNFLYATNANNNQQYAYLQLVIKDIDTSNVVSLERAFRNSALKDVAFLNKLNTKSCKNFFNMLQCQYITEMDFRGVDVTSSEGNTENDGISTQAEYMYCLRDIHFGNFLSNPNNNGCRPIKTSVSMLVNIDADIIRININLSTTGVLTKQSIINIINASQANLTHTLQASVYAKCASGGVWHTDIQAAIDAKAAQGFTVTLISA